MPYQVQLDNFKGPLDLLLYFIKRDELDIYDIPIAQITDEFTQVIDNWRQMNLFVAGEFIDMVSMLMRVKVRMMLPKQNTDEDGEFVDPRTELVQRLIDYKRYTEGADMLKLLAEKRSHLFTRKYIKVADSEKNDELGQILSDLTLYELAKMFKNVLQSRPVITSFELSREKISLDQQKEFILKHFDGDRRLKFSNLLRYLDSRVQIIVTFLALLELVRDGTCSLKQIENFSDIELIHVFKGNKLD